MSAEKLEMIRLFLHRDNRNITFLISFAKIVGLSDKALLDFNFEMPLKRCDPCELLQYGVY